MHLLPWVRKVGVIVEDVRVVDILSNRPLFQHFLLSACEGLQCPLQLLFV